MSPQPLFSFQSCHISENQLQSSTSAPRRAGEPGMENCSQDKVPYHQTGENFNGEGSTPKRQLKTQAFALTSLARSCHLSKKVTKPLFLQLACFSWATSPQDQVEPQQLFGSQPHWAPPLLRLSTTKASISHLPFTPQKRLATRTAARTFWVPWFIIHAWTGSMGWFIAHTGTPFSPPNEGRCHCSLSSKSTLLFSALPTKDTGLHSVCLHLDWWVFPKSEEKEVIPAFSKLFYINNDLH